MRLLVLSTNSPYGELRYVHSSVGGAEMALRRLAEHLAATGDEVAYLSTARHGVRPLRSMSEERICGVRVLHLRGPSVPLANRVAGPLHRRVFESTVAGVCCDLAVQTILTYATIPDTLSAVRARRSRPGLRVVEWMAGRSWELHMSRHPEDVDILSEALCGTDATLFETDCLREYTERMMRDYGVEISSECAKVNFGVDSSPSGIRDAPFGDTPYVFSAGMFKPGSKRQDILIDAMPTVLSNVPDMHLVMTGVGELLEERRQQARELGISDRVHFLGLVPRPDVFMWLRNAQAFVLATEFEGKPQAVLEALASGIPCVVSDIPPMRELFAEEPELLDACLSDNEANHFGERMGSLLTDEAKLRRVRSATRRIGSAIVARGIEGMDEIRRILSVGLR